MRVLQLDDQHIAGPNGPAAAQQQRGEQPCDSGFVSISRNNPATATRSSSSSNAAAAEAGGGGGDDDSVVLLLPSDDEQAGGGDEDEEEPDWGGSSEVSSCSGSSDTFSQVGLPGATEVVYVREGVAVCPSRQPNSRILGRLSLVKQHAVLFLSWLPYTADAGPAAAGQEEAAAAAAAAEEDVCGSGGSGDFDGCSDDDCSDWAADELAAAAAAAAAADERVQHSSRRPRCLPQQQQQAQQQPLPATQAEAAAAAAGGRSQAYAIHPIPVSDIRALLSHTPVLSWRVLSPASCSHLVVVLGSGLTLPPLFFTRGGLAQLLRVLGQHASLVRGASDGASSSQVTWLVNETADPLQPSLLSLDLDDLMLGAPPPGASSVAAPSGLSSAEGAWQQIDPAAAAGPRGSSSRLPWGGHGAGYAGSSIPWGLSHPAAAGGGGSTAAAGGSSQGWRGIGSSLGGSQLISSIMAGQGSSNGSSSALLARHLARTLRQVGQLAVDAGSCLVAAAVEGWQADTLRHYEQEVQLLDELLLVEQQPPPGGSRGTNSSSSSSLVQIAEDREDGGNVAAAVAAAAAGTVVAPSPASPGLPDSSSSNSSGCGVAQTALGGFELLAAAPSDPLAAVRSRPAPPPLSADELASFFDAAGVMRDEAGFRQRCFTAGIEPSARRQAWPFLLGVFPPGSSSSSRAQQRRQQQQQYAALRAQWRSISPAQAARFSGWRERRSRIDKDVRRTDRQHPFYRGRAAAERLVALRDLLRCFSLHNYDLGYCQGMSDLAAPLLLVAGGDEVEAFWWFEALMARLGGNFLPDQAAMAAQLAALRRLVQVLDPQLHAFLEERDCLDLFFAFRWLLIHFKREFPFEEVLRLWEAFWSCPLTPHLHLFLAAALLIQHRRALLADPSLDADGLLAFWLGAAGRLDLAASLRLAEALVVVSGAAGRDCLAGLPE